MIRAVKAVVIAACLVVCAASVAQAKPRHPKKDKDKVEEPTTAADEPDKPWAQGVSKGKQKKALEVFKEGNALYEEGKYTEALAVYEQALKLWDHPNIQFNLAVCLFNIRQPLAAWDHLESALRFGEGPLGKRLFEEAQTYKALLESSLARLEVTNEKNDADVMLDGKQLLFRKGTKTIHLLAGPHQLVATADGMETESKALDLPAGVTSKEVIDLAPAKVKIKVEQVRVNYERRWSWWLPWTLEGSGVAVALIGTGVYLSARSDMKAYDAALRAQCSTGCKPNEIPASLGVKRTSAEAKGSIAIALWGLGGAVALGAGVMAVANRPREVEHKPQVTAVVTPDYFGVALAMPLR
jgi:tetratricopeptide (TPR) repeat protein